jgi:hypothetical protein
MSTKIFLKPANSIEEIQGQVRDQEVSLGMEVLGIGMFQTDDVPPIKNNFVNITSHLGNDLPELHIQLVPPDIATTDASLSDFFNALIASNTIVDYARVLISDIEQQIVLFRTRASPADSPEAPPGAPAIPQPGSAGPPSLPDYALDIAEGMPDVATGMPWDQSVSRPGMDVYRGMMPGRFRLFQNIKVPNGVINVVYYECKLDIDNDGSGGNAAQDPFHSSDTNLHDMNNNALDANRVAFAVLPLDRSETRVKIPGLPDFGRDLGLQLGDVGMAFWRQSGAGPVRSQSFIYGDKGPANKIGEGSVHLADALGVNSNPISGGIDASTMKRLKKGIIHIAFPGSGKAFMEGNRSTLIPNQIDSVARRLLGSLVQQSQTIDEFGDIHRKLDEAYNKNDAAAVAALFTEDALFVAPDGMFSGRQDIENKHADKFNRSPITTFNSGLQRGHPNPIDNAVWQAGQWTSTFQSQAEPASASGFWTAIYVHEGEALKIHLFTLTERQRPALFG